MTAQPQTQHGVRLLSVRADSGGQISTEQNSYEARVCVFIVVNVLMCSSDLIDLDAFTTRLRSLFLLLFLPKTLFWHTHNSEQCVKAAPNVWVSRHSAGLPPSLPAASSWPLDTSSSTWPTQLVQSLHNVGRSLAYTHTHTHTNTDMRAWADTNMYVGIVRQTQTHLHITQKCTHKYKEIKANTHACNHPSQHTLRPAFSLAHTQMHAPLTSHHTHTHRHILNHLLSLTPFFCLPAKVRRAESSILDTTLLFHRLC